MLGRGALKYDTQIRYDHVHIMRLTQAEFSADGLTCVIRASQKPPPPTHIVIESSRAELTQSTDK